MKTVFRWCFGVWTIAYVSGIGATALAASPWEELEALETGRVSQNGAAPFKPDPKETAWGGWYAGMHAAAVIAPDADFVTNGVVMGVDYDTGFGLGGSFGYAYDFGLRFDTEVTFRALQASQLDISGFGFSGSGNVDTISFMLNSWFDVKFLSFLLGDWVPYVGAGAGVMHAWTNVGSGGFPVVEAEDTAFVWQGGGGLGYKITDRLLFTLDYRFLRTFGSLLFDDPFYAEPFKAKYKVHNITIGFRGFF